MDEDLQVCPTGGEPIMISEKVTSKFETLVSKFFFMPKSSFMTVLTAPWRLCMLQTLQASLARTGCVDHKT